MTAGEARTGMECATGKEDDAAAMVCGVDAAGPDRAGFREDLLDLVYARVNRCDLRRMSLKYAKLEDRSMLLIGRIAGMADLEAGRMLDRLDGVQAVMVGMAMEMAYRRGMAEGMGALMRSEVVC